MSLINYSRPGKDTNIYFLIAISLFLILYSNIILKLFIVNKIVHSDFQAKIKTFYMNTELLIQLKGHSILLESLKIIKIFNSYSFLERIALYNTTLKYSYDEKNIVVKINFDFLDENFQYRYPAYEIYLTGDTSYFLKLNPLTYKLSLQLR
jgi:hypothetical protein